MRLVSWETTCLDSLRFIGAGMLRLTDHFSTSHKCSMGFTSAWWRVHSWNIQESKVMLHLDSNMERSVILHKYEIVSGKWSKWHHMFIFFYIEIYIRGSPTYRKQIRATIETISSPEHYWHIKNGILGLQAANLSPGFHHIRWRLSGEWIKAFFLRRLTHLLHL